MTQPDAGAEPTPPLHRSLSSDEVLAMVEMLELTIKSVIDKRRCQGEIEYKCEITGFTAWLSGGGVKKTKAGGKGIRSYERRLERNSRLRTLRKMPHRIQN